VLHFILISSDRLQGEAQPADVPAKKHGQGHTEDQVPLSEHGHPRHQDGLQRRERGTY